MDQSSAGEPGGIVVIDSFFPNELSGLGFEGVIPADLIAEQKRVPVTVGNHDHGRTNGSIRVEGPLDAAALRPQRVDRATRTADEDLPVEEGGEREGVHVTLVTERPFEPELLHLIDGQAGDVRGLKAGLSPLGLHPFQMNLDLSLIETFRSLQNASAGKAVSAAPVPRNFATASRSSRVI